MKKNILQAKVTNRYNEHGATITQLIQAWINEKYFFENLKNNKNRIEKKI